MSVLERCPLYRGHEYYVTLKAPLMLMCSLRQNWPKQVFKVQVEMSRRKEVEKGKQQLESLQRIKNLDDKWQYDTLTHNLY